MGLAADYGKNATFSDPVSIGDVVDYFGNDDYSLKNSFTLTSGMNMYGFNDLDTYNAAPYKLSEWRRYDQNRSSYSVDGAITTEQDHIDYFTNPFNGDLDILNNIYGRACSGEYDVKLNPGHDDHTIDSATLLISTDNNFTLAAGTSNGGTGVGSLTYSFNPGNQYYDGHGTLQDITQDTEYTLIIIAHDLLLYNGVWENSVKEVSNLAQYLNITTGHPATAASFTTSPDGMSTSNITVWEEDGEGGSPWAFRIYNSGETAGTCYVKLRVQDDPDTPVYTLTTDTISVNVAGKVRGGDNAYTDDGGNPGYRMTWYPGMTVYCYYSINDGSSYTLCGEKVIVDTRPL